VLAAPPQRRKPATPVSLSVRFEMNAMLRASLSSLATNDRGADG
jgi:hypothetical protein